MCRWIVIILIQLVHSRTGTIFLKKMREIWYLPGFSAKRSVIQFIKTRHELCGMFSEIIRDWGLIVVNNVALLFKVIFSRSS